MCAITRLKWSFPITLLIYVGFSAYQPLYLAAGTSQPLAYAFYTMGIAGGAFIMVFVMQASMMMIFIFKQMSDHARSTLYELIDNIPDAVIVLEPK